MIARKYVDQMIDEFESIVVYVTGEAGAYARAFAAYCAEYATSLLIEPSDEGEERLRASALAVAETIDEIGDQAAHAIVRRIVAWIQLVSGVARVVAGMP